MGGIYITHTKPPWHISKPARNTNWNLGVLELWLSPGRKKALQGEVICFVCCRGKSEVSGHQPEGKAGRFEVVFQVPICLLINLFLLFTFQGQSCLDNSFGPETKRMPSQQHLISPTTKQNLHVRHFGRHLFLPYYFILVLFPTTFLLFLLWPSDQQGRLQQTLKKLCNSKDYVHCKVWLCVKQVINDKWDYGYCRSW